MLTADPYALLAVCGTGPVGVFQANKNVLELVHPRIGEQKRFITYRNNRCTRNKLMTLALKELNKPASYFLGRNQFTYSK